MARRINRPIILVGSIPGKSAEEVFTTWGGGLRELLPAIPDGELDRRRAWITFLAQGAFARCPALEILRRPVPVDPSHLKEWRGPGGDWLPREYSDGWLFRVKPDAKAIDLGKLGYADEAIKSYAVFKTLREAQKLPKETRFQICLPMQESGLRMFLTGPDELQKLWKPYSDALKRELKQIFSAIPASELCIQWDVCVEILGLDPASRRQLPWDAHGEPMQRYIEAIADLSPHVAAETLLGIHLCYGDLGHKHLVEPVDLGYCVAMANEGVKRAGRAVDFVHMPVPRDRNDDAYFKPLDGLSIGDAKLYLGLLHVTDGEAGARARIAAAKRHANDFGIGTECGFGRRPLDHIPQLLHLHRVAGELLATA